MFSNVYRQKLVKIMIEIEPIPLKSTKHRINQAEMISRGG